LHGAFEVQRRIGQGGMGVVYLARDLRLDRSVALKTLPCLSSGLVPTIRAEARAMAALDHPQIAVLYGLEDWRGTPVLVVEYLPGGTLASRLTEGPIPVPEAIAMGASIADALAALHARGWLHRDVKPSNIGFGRGGGPKLLDFGLTQWRQVPLADASGSDQPIADDSGTGVVAGTPLYLSPDALDGEAPGEHDDVWALSLVLVEMIAGAHPFRAPSREDVLRLIRRREIADLRTFASGMPVRVADLLTRALHPRRTQRLVKARELAAALRALDPAS
jgi:serine/threonine protein kinase